jgi:hypothetical protein
MGIPVAQAAQPISQQQPFESTQKADVLPPPPNGTLSTGKAGKSSGSQATTTNAATSGQPQMGQPNTYSNTVGPWDNSNNQTQTQSGKGKGH